MKEPESSYSIQRRLGADRGVYLKSTAVVEPLICGWYAWAHLLAPVQLALNLRFRYLPLLKAFLTNPRVHIAASAEKECFSGPFVQLASSDLSAIQELLVRTASVLGRLLTLAEHVKSLDGLIQAEADGYSLNELYGRFPQDLGGLVELMYDVNSHPKMQLLEDLVYEEFGRDVRKGAQEVSVYETTDGSRHFFLNTPRIRSAGVMTFSASFSDPSLDVLLSTRTEAMGFADLERALGVSGMATGYGNLFTPTPPERARTEDASTVVRLRYFGHACVLVQTPDVAVLIDPMFATGAADEGCATRCTRYGLQDLPKRIDYVVITHGHPDHCSAEMLLQIRPRVGRIVVPLNNRGNVADPSLRGVLRELGFRDVISVDYFDAVSFPGGRIVSMPFMGEHADLDIYSKQSIFLEANGKRLLFLADSDGWDPALYARVAGRIIGAEPARLDALFLGMECQGAPLSWLYGPLLTKPVPGRNDNSRRLSGCDCARAIRVIESLRCERAYVYAMGQEPWLRYIMGLEYDSESIQLRESDEFVDYCRSRGITAERLYGGRDLAIP
ncbi:MAG TPA: MBL fold metallo-hydrolase [Steroidobacteraceae bacterium]|nr:MBL fold metallo-hydrolase [Steroidobacteraceae bacterium]